MAKECDLQLADYGISRDRYRELKYFCRQYMEKKAKLEALREPGGLAMDGMPHGSNTSDPTGKRALMALQLARDIALIEETAQEVAGVDWWQMLAHVTDGIPVEQLEIHQGRNQFYQIRRKFFWLLDQRK